MKISEIHNAWGKTRISNRLVKFRRFEESGCDGPHEKMNYKCERRVSEVKVKAKTRRENTILQSGFFEATRNSFPSSCVPLPLCWPCSCTCTSRPMAYSPSHPSSSSLSLLLLNLFSPFLSTSLLSSLSPLVSHPLHFISLYFYLHSSASRCHSYLGCKDIILIISF